MTNEHVGAIAMWVGQEHRSCWELVRDAYRLEGIELDADPYKAAEQFVTLPEGSAIHYGDVVAIAHGKVRNLPTHVGFVLDADSGTFIHSLEGVGVSLSFVYRRPWSERIVGVMRRRA